jgi:hypothetical protein
MELSISKTVSYLTNDKLKWDSSDIGELTDKDFVLGTIGFEPLDDEEFKTNGLYYIDSEGDRQSMKVSIFKHNDMNVFIDKFKPDFGLPLMKYLIFTYKGTKYLMSQDMKDEYTNQRILRPYTNTYLTSIRKTLAFQWIFCIKCTNLDKTISRLYDTPAEFNIDGSHVISCFEMEYKYNINDDMKTPKGMINKFFDKNEAYFLSTCQYLLCEGYTDVNVYIQYIRNKAKEYWPPETKLNAYWLNNCLKRIRYILNFPIIEDMRYPQMGILRFQKENITVDK